MSAPATLSKDLPEKPRTPAASIPWRSVCLTGLLSSVIGILLLIGNWQDATDRAEAYHAIDAWSVTVSNQATRADSAAYRRQRVQMEGARSSLAKERDRKLFVRFLELALFSIGFVAFAWTALLWLGTNQYRRYRNAIDDLIRGRVDAAKKADATARAKTEEAEIVALSKTATHLSTTVRTLEQFLAKTELTAEMRARISATVDVMNSLLKEIYAWIKKRSPAQEQTSTAVNEPRTAGEHVASAAAAIAVAQELLKAMESRDEPRAEPGV